MSSVTLLSITTDSKLNFKETFQEYFILYYKVYAPRGGTKISNIRKAKILACSMIKSQFADCSLTECSARRNTYAKGWKVTINIKLYKWL